MKFKIPFTFSETEVLKKRSKYFLRFTRRKGKKINDALKNSGEKIEGNQYFSICYRNFAINFLIMAIILTSALGIADFFIKTQINYFFYLGSALALLISIFIFMIGYYKFINSKKKIMEEI